MVGNKPNNEPAKTDIKSKTVDWLLGQPFNNVLLVAILASIAYGFYYGVPAHLQMIQQGYREMEQSHKEERQQIMQMYDKWVNRGLGEKVSSPSSVASNQEQE